MNIGGLQKLTLLDYPGKIACTVFTSGCNYRCPFCHNSKLIESSCSGITEEDIFGHLKKRKGKLEAVCISGGEPLIHSGIEDFIRKINELGYPVKLDTNGTYPERLKSLSEKGLIDYVAMDIKNSPEKYNLAAGIKSNDIASVNESIEFLKRGTVPYEFRTTTVEELHDEEDFRSIGKWLQGADKYALQKYRESGDVLSKGLHPLSDEAMENAANILKHYISQIVIR